MMSWLKVFIFFAFLNCTQFSVAGNEPKIGIHAIRGYEPNPIIKSLTDHFFVLTSTKQDIVINSVVLNRGNSELLINYKFPIILKFSQKAKLLYTGPVLLELTVNTDKGARTLTFDP
jgi:hypothetical protein